MPGDSFVIKAPTVQQSISVEIKGEDKLISFSKLLNNIANGSRLQEYWGTQEQAIRRVTEAYGKFVQTANQQTGGELIKSMNALKAMAGDDIPNILSNYTSISKAFEQASASFGHAFTEYSVPNFKDVFASINDMKAFGLETETVFKRLGSSTDMQQLQQQVETLTRTCAFLKSEIRDLEAERDKLLNGEEISRLREIEQSFNSLKSTMASEFASFLTANDLDPGRWGQFSTYFDQIYDGSMTAKEAITQVRSELIWMFREGQNVTAGDSVFSSTQMQEFITKLDDACAKIEQMRQEIQSLSGGAALRELAKGMSESEQYTEKQRDAIRELVAQSSGISSVSELLAALIQNFDTTDEKVRTSVDTFRGLLEVLNQIAQVDPVNMSGFNDSLKNLHALQNLSVDPKQTERLASALKMLGEIPSLPNLAMLGSVDLRGFSNVKVSTTLGYLVTYLPPLSQGVDVAKLEALSHISLANFDHTNLKVSKASMEHLRDLIAQIQGMTGRDVFSQYDYGAGQVSTAVAQELQQASDAVRDNGAAVRDNLGNMPQQARTAEAAITGYADKVEAEMQRISKAIEKSFNLDALTAKLKRGDLDIIRQALQTGVTGGDPFAALETLAGSKTQLARTTDYIKTGLGNPVLMELNNVREQYETFIKYIDNDYSDLYNKFNALALLFKGFSGGKDQLQIRGADLYSKIDTSKIPFASFEEFQAALRGLSINFPGLASYSSTLGLDTLNLSGVEEQSERIRAAAERAVAAKQQEATAVSGVSEALANGTQAANAHTNAAEQNIAAAQKTAAAIRDEKAAVTEGNKAKEGDAAAAQLAAKAEADKQKVSELLTGALKREQEATKGAGDASEQAAKQESQYVNTTMKRVFDMQRSIEDARNSLGKLTDGKSRPEYKTYGELIVTLEEVIQKYYKYQEVLAANPDDTKAAAQVLSIKDVWGQIADVAMKFAEARESVNSFTHKTKDGMKEADRAAREFLQDVNALMQVTSKNNWGVYAEKLKSIERSFKEVQNPSEELREKMEKLRDILTTLSDANAAPEAKLRAYSALKSAVEGVNLAIRNEANAERDAAKAQKELESSASGAAKEVERLNNVFASLRDKSKFDTASFEKMRDLLAQVNDTSLPTDQRQAALQQLNDLIKQTSDSLHQLTAAEKAEAAAKKESDAADKQKASLIKQLNSLLDQCTRAEQRYAIVSKSAFARENYKGIQDTKTFIQQLLQQLNGANPKLNEIADGARRAQTAFSNFNTALKTGGGLLGNWLSTGMSQLKSRLSYTFGLAAMVYKAVNEIKQMISTAVELDSAMNTLQIVTRASGGEMEAYAKRVSAAAQETAQSTKDLIDATTVYARLGYSMDESAILSKYTAMLQGVGDIGASDAQNAMTAIIKSFGKNVNEIEDVMDKLVVVGNNFPISVSQLAEGMNNASSMLAVAGNSFEESIALLTAANTTVQDISKASTALRTIAARIRKMTTEDGEIIEESKYDEMIKALTQHNVSLVDANGEYRKTYDVIRDIAKVWNDLSTMQQAAVSEALAGTRQQNVFSSLVTQFQEAENAMDRMADAGGELQAAYDIRMESIEAHVQRMKAAYDQLSMDFVDSEFAKRAVDLLTNIINLLDLLINKFGVIGTVLGASSLPGIIKLVTSGKLTSAMTQLAGMLGLLKSSSTALTVVGASGATAGASLAAMGPVIMGVVAAFAALVHIMQQVEKQRRQALSDTYDTSMQNAKEKGGVYDLYLAYLDAKEKQDETEESKKRLKQASEELAAALGYEKDAAEQLNEAFAEMSAEQIKRAASDAKIALDSAQKQLIDAYDNTGSPNGNGQAFVSIFGRGHGIDIMEGGQEERAQNLARVYELMRARQAELAESSQTTTREYLNLSDAIKWLKPQVDDLSTATNTLGDMQEHVNDIMRGTTDPAKKLGQALDRLSNNAVQALLSGEYFDEDLEEIRQVMQEYYATPERMQQALKNNPDVILDRVSQPLKNAKEELTRIQKEIADQGIDISKTVFGNIDTNSRQVLEWNTYNLLRFKDELASWGEDINSMAGSISTVFGGAANYDGVEIAFSPILQTDQGPVLLSQEAVDDYIWSLVEELNESKEKWSKEDLFELDARGIEKDGRKIKGLIADVGDTAKRTSEIMHYLGRDGALALAERDVQTAQAFRDLFAEEIEPSGITSSVEKSTAELATLRDELKLAIEALNDYKKAMEGGEIDDPIKEAAEIYKGALEDIQSGRKGTNRIKNAAELFLGRDNLDAIDWSLAEAERLLQDPMWKFIFDPEGTSEYDYGARVAQYVEQNFSKEKDGVWMSNGEFYYESLDKLAKAFNNSKIAADLFLGALQAHSVNTINSIEENQALIASFKELEGELHSTDAAVRKTVEDMFTDGMDDFQIHDTLEQYRQAGIINLDEATLHATISEVLEHLHAVEKEKYEAEMTLKHDKVDTAIDLITRSLVDLVTNGGNGWNIEVGMQTVGDIPENTTTKNSSGSQKATVYPGKVNYPGSAAVGKKAGQGGGDTLVNELGPELISDKGRAFIANGGRPGFVRLSDDAIVFTAEETKDILHGKRNVNGKALAQGNVGRGSLIGRLIHKGTPAKAYKYCPECGASNSVTATRCSRCGSTFLVNRDDAPTSGTWTCVFCGARNLSWQGSCYNCGHGRYESPTQYTDPTEGSPWYDPELPVGPSLDEQVEYIRLLEEAKRMREEALAERRRLREEAERASGSKIDSTSKKTSLGKSLAGTGGGNYVGGADYQSYAEPQKVDWVAVRINRLQRAIADLEKVATSGFKMLETRLQAARDQISRTTDEIKVMEQAYDRYIQEANSVGLSDSIATLVREGEIDITKYDDDTRKKIDEYTEW